MFKIGKGIGIVIVLIFLTILVVSVVTQPRGSLAFGRCGDVSPTSEICICPFENETLFINENGTRECVLKEVT